MIVRRLSQVLLSSIFISGGVNQVLEPGTRAGTIEAAGLPGSETAVRANGAAMVLGGGMLALNSAPRLGALMLLVSLVPTTIAGHAFWKTEGDAQRQQWTQFAKNLGLIAALLMVLSSGRRR